MPTTLTRRLDPRQGPYQSGWPGYGGLRRRLETRRSRPDRTPVSGRARRGPSQRLSLAPTPTLIRALTDRDRDFLHVRRGAGLAGRDVDRAQQVRALGRRLDLEAELGVGHAGGR